MTASSFQLVSEHPCFDGVQRFYQHHSAAIGLPMRFSVFLPSQSAAGPVPAMVYLAGLTCTEETFPIKAGAQRLASALGLALIAPDTSPRGTAVEGQDASWDFGTGAGFYLDATQDPWAQHWQMESYLLRDLLPAVVQALPVAGDRLGICGHSMGGHGALTLALRHPEVFKSVSALAPICAPSQVPWGIKAFTGYLGPNPADWASHDATALLRSASRAPWPEGLLIDQGLGDKFLAEQLRPDLLEAACQAIHQPLTLRRHEGHDHGYYFIQTFIADHLQHHHRILAGG
jgi:S-formylglutathione hydrolase